MPPHNRLHLACTEQLLSAKNCAHLGDGTGWVAELHSSSRFLSPSQEVQPKPLAQQGQATFLIQRRQKPGDWRIWLPIPLREPDRASGHSLFSFQESLGKYIEGP